MFADVLNIRTILLVLFFQFVIIYIFPGILYPVFHELVLVHDSFHVLNAMI